MKKIIFISCLVISFSCKRNYTCHCNASTLTGPAEAKTYTVKEKNLTKASEACLEKVRSDGYAVYTCSVNS